MRRDRRGMRVEGCSEQAVEEERHGLRKCKACGRQFTVRTGTIFEESHSDLHLWLQAICLMTGSEKGIGATQLHRTLGITIESAWLTGHRIRAAMRDDGTVNFGSGDGEAEVDETFIGLDKSDTGRARSMAADDMKAGTLTPVLLDNIAREATVCTDDAGQHRSLRQP